MPAISRKAALAIEAVLYVALNAVDRTVRSGEITQRQNVPQRYLEPVLQALVRDGVLVGVRGPRGGYKLARERRRISLGEIVRIVSVVEGIDEPQIVSPLQEQVIGPALAEAERTLMNTLESISIDDLHAQAREKRVGQDDPARLDFII
jgi:Rrf2 family iron-sulfur cluster assembly transcriptional regulator